MTEYEYEIRMKNGTIRREKDAGTALGTSVAIVGYGLTAWGMFAEITSEPDKSETMLSESGEINIYNYTPEQLTLVGEIVRVEKKPKLELPPPNYEGRTYRCSEYGRCSAGVPCVIVMPTTKIHKLHYILVGTGVDAPCSIDCLAFPDDGKRRFVEIPTGE